MTVDVKDDKQKAEYMRRFVDSRPYHFMVDYVDIMSTYGKDEYTKQYADALAKVLNPDVNDYLQVIHLDERMVDIVNDTQAEIFYRPLFFHQLMIDNVIQHKGWLLKGILVLDMNQSENLMFSKQRGLVKDWRIAFVAINPDTFVELVVNTKLLSEDSIDVVTPEPDYRGYTEDVVKGLMREFIIKVRNFLCNLVDFVDNREQVRVAKIPTTPAQNVKRMRRGKIPLPTVTRILPRMSFLGELNSYNSVRRKYSHRFLVRGHWRHLRSERYGSERQRRIWIRPFFKGRGIYVRKLKYVTDDADDGIEQDIEVN